MRGLRVISFEQFRGMCESFTRNYCEDPLCSESDNIDALSECHPKWCPKWRKIGRAGTKVVKVTAQNTSSTQLLCPWVADGDCPNVNIKCSVCIRNHDYKDYAVVAQQRTC